MRIRVEFGYVLSGIAALAVLAGCSGAGVSGAGVPQMGGGGSGAQSSSRHADAMSVVIDGARGLQERKPSIAPIVGFGRAGTCPTAPVAFISDYSANVVYESDRAGAVCATLTGFSSPTGLSVDQSGEVYVANSGAHNVVVVSSLTGSLINTLADGNEAPQDVAIDAHGDIAVTNPQILGGSGNVAFYAAGSTVPTGTASDPSSAPLYCAFDKQGNLDLDGINIGSGTPSAGVVFRGNLHNQQAVIHFFNGTLPVAPQGLQVLNTPGKYGELAILDQGSGNTPTIDAYPAFSYPNLGPPTTTALPGSGLPEGVAFSPSGRLVLLAGSAPAAALLYSYPAGKVVASYTVSNSNDALVGAAIYPTEQFALR